MRRLAFSLILLIAVCTTMQAAIVDFVCDGDTLSIRIEESVAPETAGYFLQMIGDNLFNNTTITVDSSGFAWIDIAPESLRQVEAMPSFSDTLFVEVCPDSLGLDTLIVANSEYRDLLPATSPMQNQSVKNLLLALNYAFSDSLSSIQPDYGTLAFTPLQPRPFFIVTRPEGAPWLTGRCVVLGIVVKGMEIVSKPQASKLKISSATIR